MSGKGKEYLSEIQETQDQITGARIWQVTNQPCINHNLYFLTSSFLPDERSLVFASFRSGVANFYRAGFPGGPIVQLTDSPDINSFSAIVSSDGTKLYFTRGSSVVALAMDNLSETVLADYPGGKMGEVDISCDGHWLVSAIRIDGGNGIAVTSTNGGGSIVYRQERTIIHPQFHPSDPDLIEYAADPAPRMYLIQRDGSNNRCLYEHQNDECVVHETWLGDTGDLIYTVWPKSLRRMKVPSLEIQTIADFNAWHICPSRDGRVILCDTNHPDIGMQLIDVATGEKKTVCYPESSNSGSQWIKGRYAVKEDFEAAAKAGASDISQELSWMEMKTDTVYGPQWTHPHPSFSNSHRYATFTSDRTGHSQVYVVEIPE